MLMYIDRYYKIINLVTYPLKSLVKDKYTKFK